LGNFENDVKTGFCHCELGLERFYDGMMFKGEKHGIGRLTSSSTEQNEEQHKTETCFTGQYQFDLKHGFGRLESPSLIYVGGWFKGVRHGLGYQKSFGAESYYGYWKNGERNGLGYETCEDREYKGEFLNDLYHGYAIVKAPNRQPVHAYFEKGKLVEIVDARNPEIGRISQFKLDIDNFFRKSKKKLVEFDYFIQDNKREIESQRDFNQLREEIETCSIDLDRKLQDIQYHFQSVVDRFEILHGKLEIMAAKSNLNLEIEDKIISLDRVS
jgi:hypothetical protein